ncbi:MAG TPA: ECF transporter S component, partial [Clostridiales bacterium]|nr:ECF transporter S component [Clostridiales bacterium]
MNKEDLDIKAMIFTGLWIAVVTVVTMAIVIPIPLTQGYVNL